MPEYQEGDLVMVIESLGVTEPLLPEDADKPDRDLKPCLPGVIVHVGTVEQLVALYRKQLMAGVIHVNEAWYETEEQKEEQQQLLRAALERGHEKLGTGAVGLEWDDPAVRSTKPTRPEYGAKHYRLTDYEAHKEEIR